MDTILPCDENTEDAVLGAVITYPEVYDEVAPYFTETEVFYQKQARMLWKKISLMIRTKEENKFKKHLEKIIEKSRRETKE